MSERSANPGDQRGCQLTGLRGGRDLWRVPLDPPLRLAAGVGRGHAAQGHVAQGHVAQLHVR
jgi:hypothetical protein